MRLRKILFNPGQIPINCPLLYEGVFYEESLRGNTILENSKHSRCIYTRRFSIKETLPLNLKNACWECLQHQQSWCHPLPLRKDRTPMANRTRPIIMRPSLWSLRRQRVRCLPCREKKNCRAWSPFNPNSSVFSTSSNGSMMREQSSKRRRGWSTPWRQTWMISSSRVQSMTATSSTVHSGNKGIKQGGYHW